MMPISYPTCHNLDLVRAIVNVEAMSALQYYCIYSHGKSTVYQDQPQ